VVFGASKVVAQNGRSGLVAFLLLIFAAAWVLVSINLLTTTGDSDAAGFVIALGVFIALGIAYLGLHDLKGLGWASVPILITVEALTQFGIVPAWRFAIGAERVDGFYLKAITLVLFGFLAFWSASLFFSNRKHLRFTPATGQSRPRVIQAALAMTGIGAIAETMMWKMGIFAYLAAGDTRSATLPYMEWIVISSKLLTGALAVSAIERFGKHSRSAVVAAIFWISLVASIVYGLMSGMKAFVLEPVLVVILVYGMTKKRIPWQVILLPLLLAVIYPFNIAYRHNLNQGYRSQVNTLGGLEDTAVKTVDDVLSGYALRVSNAGLASSSNRLSLLSFFHDILVLPSPSLLNGDEKVWMAPLYPLIPRFLWKDKPVLDKGIRVSVALGRPDSTSSAETPVGDLYILGGSLGVVGGMLAFGSGLQLYMNWLARKEMTEKGLFIYLGMLAPLLNFENDVTGMIAATVQTALVIVIAAQVIYGPGMPGSSSPAALASLRNS